MFCPHSNSSSKSRLTVNFGNSSELVASETTCGPDIGLRAYEGRGRDFQFSLQDWWWWRGESRLGVYF